MKTTTLLRLLLIFALADVILASFYFSGLWVGIQTIFWGAITWAVLTLYEHFRKKAINANQKSSKED